ncbi:MAG: hypothetical protein ACRD3F_00790 [Acidobacteriaceae bacterium]
MTDAISQILPIQASPAEETFPTLTPEQVARVAKLGVRRTVQRDEMLIHVGDQDVPFYFP